MRDVSTRKTKTDPSRAGSVSQVINRSEHLQGLLLEPADLARIEQTAPLLVGLRFGEKHQDEERSFPPQWRKSFKREPRCLTIDRLVCIGSSGLARCRRQRFRR